MSDSNPSRPETPAAHKEGTPKMRNFDGANTNHYDVILDVAGQEFHVIRMHLAMHSEVFDRMFFSNFAEKDKNIVELKEVDPHHFHLFLEVINGEVCLNDDNVIDALQLCQFFLAETAMRRCEEYLTYRSEMSLQKKFELAMEYNFEDLKAKSISAISSEEEFDTIAAVGPEELDPTIKDMLLDKSVELHRQDLEQMIKKQNEAELEKLRFDLKWTLWRKEQDAIHIDRMERMEQAQNYFPDLPYEEKAEIWRREALVKKETKDEEEKMRREMGQESLEPQVERLLAHLEHLGKTGGAHDYVC